MEQKKPNLVFLHIPKTAGQSVHHFLEFFVRPEEVAPARVNGQLFLMSIKEIQNFRLFSGHMDWSLLDCVENPKFVFTVLREPISRIVSFYLYLRREAEALSANELQLPQYQGHRASLDLSCDEYFSSGHPELRTFLDDHYDNFYTYYFAGRRFDARQKLAGRKRIDKTFTDQKIVDMAVQNLALLNGVYSVDALHLLESDIRTLTGISSGGPTLENLRVNTGDSNNINERMAQLEKFGATKITFKRIQEMTVLDQQIWQRFNNHRNASLLTDAS